LPPEVVDRKHFTCTDSHAQIHLLKATDTILYVLIPKWGKGTSIGIDFGVVGKPIPTFLIAVL